MKSILNYLKDKLIDTKEIIFTDGISHSTIRTDRYNTPVDVIILDIYMSLEDDGSEITVIQVKLISTSQILSLEWDTLG